MQAIKCNDQINIINNKKTTPIIVVGIGEKNGVRTYDFIRHNPEIFTAPIYRFELNYADILEIVNDLITLKNEDELLKASHYIEQNSLLKTQEKKYLFMKIARTHENYFNNNHKRAVCRKRRKSYEKD